MVEVQLTHHKVELYNSIEELSIERFHKYNKMLLVDSGIGGTMEDVDKHLGRIAALVRQDKKEEVGKELENMRQNIYMVQAGLNPKMLSFAALAKSIDGKDITDISDDGLKQIVEQLKNETITNISQALEDVKKKIDDELAAYFPSFFDTASGKEYHDLMRQRAIAVLDGIIGDKEDNKVQAMTDRLVTFAPTRKFSGIDNAEVKHDKSYLSTCHIISQNLHSDAKGMTVAEYYSALELLKEQQRQQQKALKKK